MIFRILLCVMLMKRRTQRCTHGRASEASEWYKGQIMNLAGFCRNCLSKWYLAAAKERNIELDFDAAREVVYGMPYAEWKEKYQHEASKEQQEIYEKTKPLHAKIT